MLRRAARGDVQLVRPLLADPRAGSLHYLIELKCGHGPAEPAIAELTALLGQHGLSERTWIAASSLELLAIGRRVAPTLPRVLFGQPLGKGEHVLHKPITYIWTSLSRHGLAVRLPAGTVQLLCLIGLVPRSLAAHHRLAEAARRRGLDYLPGRVTKREILEGLAASASIPGAFVYASLDSWTDR